MSHHILIVEDDESLRSLFELYLERADFIVTGVSTVEHALQVLNSEDISLALVDINLEDELSGLELIEKVRENSKFNHVKLVTLTSFPQPFDRIHPEWIDLGLNKPIQYQVLIKEVKHLLDITSA